MKEKTIEYEECYIAFLDLLGFKNRVEKKSCEEILKLYEDMKAPLTKIMFNGKCLMEEDDVKTKVMSDSICFYVDTARPNGLFALISICLAFQVKLAKLDEPVLVRGAIVKGGIYAKNDVMFGPGLTRAYLLEEKSAIYPRIIILKQLVDEIEADLKEYKQKVVNDMLIPDFDAFYIVNYFNFIDMLGNTTGCKDKLLEYANEVLASEYDSSIREKYRYIRDKILVCR